MLKIKRKVKSRRVISRIMLINENVLAKNFEFFLYIYNLNNLLLSRLLIRCPNCISGYITAAGIYL